MAIGWSSLSSADVEDRDVKASLALIERSVASPITGSPTLQSLC